MQNEQLGFSLPLPSPAGSVDVRFWGLAQIQSRSPDPNAAIRASAAVQQAVHTVIGGRLARGELAMPTLATSLPHLVPELVAQANTQLQPQGLLLGGLTLNASVPADAVAPAAAAIAAAPTPWESAASNFGGNVASHVASSVPTGVKVNVGGFNVRVGAGGVDDDSLASQVADKAKDKIIGCAIVGGVVLVLGLITMGVLAKIILFG